MNYRLYCGHLDVRELIVKPAETDFRAGFLFYQEGKLTQSDNRIKRREHEKNKVCSGDFGCTVIDDLDGPADNGL